MTKYHSSDTAVIENDRAVMGDNNPPSPMDEVKEPYLDALEEAANWLDGQAVETEEQMIAVDELIKHVRKCKTDLERARDTASKPLHDAWKAEIAAWKPHQEDVERRLKGLAALVNNFKKKLAAQKEEERRKAYEAQRAAEAAAADAAAKANAGNLAEQEEADRLKREAMEAKKAASTANRDTVKGLRTVTKFEVTDHRALLKWIAINDKDALTGFVESYARSNHKAVQMDGVKVWEEKEAY